MPCDIMLNNNNNNINDANVNFTKSPRRTKDPESLTLKGNTIPYYTILYYTILYYTILYCTILYHSFCGMGKTPSEFQTRGLGGLL